MPVWTVQSADGEDEQVQAGLLATEGGTLVALDDEGLMLRAWAPGQWRTVRHVHGVGPHPVGTANGKDNVLTGLPRG